MQTIKIKRIYEQPVAEDGYRVLVDRLWPRGVKKEAAMLDEYCKDLAPSVELRKWFDHRQDRFHEFERLYRLELIHKQNNLNRIIEIAKDSNLTLLYAAKDPLVNHAIILLKVILEHR